MCHLPDYTDRTVYTSSRVNTGAVDPSPVLGGDIDPAPSLILAFKEEKGRQKWLIDILTDNPFLMQLWFWHPVKQKGQCLDIILRQWHAVPS